MSQNLKDASLKTWTVDDRATLEQINAGSLQRIADATEKMALRYTELIDKTRRMEVDRDFWCSRSKEKDKTISNLRGQITKLKKRAVQP